LFCWANQFWDFITAEPRKKSLRLHQTLFLPNLDGILVVQDVLKVFILLLVLIVIAKLVSGLFIKVDLILLGLLQVCVELLDLVMGYTEFAQRLHAFLLFFYKLADLFPYYFIAGVREHHRVELLLANELRFYQ
jgi:hypothetical protein